MWRLGLRLTAGNISTAMNVPVSAIKSYNATFDDSAQLVRPSTVCVQVGPVLS